MKKSKRKHLITVNFPWGVCNQSCSYCAIGMHGKEMWELPYSLEQIRKAFSNKRLGGSCFINICSDGETLIHPLMPKIIENFLKEGHYVMVVTNGTMTKRIKECLEIDEKLLERLFFKLSFHFQELKRMKTLDTYFSNIDLIKESPCSFSLEYVADDEVLDNIEELKRISLERVGAIPQCTIPRDSRRKNIGLYSKYSWENYLKRCEELELDSELFEIRKESFGRKYRDYCYAGERFLWISMKTGYSHQCFCMPPLQNFMGEYNKPVKWLAVGNNCRDAHCYTSHEKFTLGVTSYMGNMSYKPTYDEIRNRKCIDEGCWLKQTYVDAFRMGIETQEHTENKKRIINGINDLLRWSRRREHNKDRGIKGK